MRRARLLRVIGPHSILFLVQLSNAKDARRGDMGQRRANLVNFDQYLELPMLSIVRKSPSKGG